MPLRRVWSLLDRVLDVCVCVRTPLRDGHLRSLLLDSLLSKCYVSSRIVMLNFVRRKASPLHPYRSRTTAPRRSSLCPTHFPSCPRRSRRSCIPPLSIRRRRTSTSPSSRHRSLHMPLSHSLPIPVSHSLPIPRSHSLPMPLSHNLNLSITRRCPNNRPAGRFLLSSRPPMASNTPAAADNNKCCITLRTNRVATHRAHRLRASRNRNHNSHRHSSRHSAMRPTRRSTPRRCRRPPIPAPRPSPPPSLTRRRPRSAH